MLTNHKLGGTAVSHWSTEIQIVCLAIHKNPAPVRFFRIYTRPFQKTDGKQDPHKKPSSIKRIVVDFQQSCSRKCIEVRFKRRFSVELCPVQSIDHEIACLAKHIAILYSSSTFQQCIYTGCLTIGYRTAKASSGNQVEQHLLSIQFGFPENRGEISLLFSILYQELYPSENLV